MSRSEEFQGGVERANVPDLIGAWERVTGATYTPTPRRPLTDAQQRRDDYLEGKAEDRAFMRREGL